MHRLGFAGVLASIAVMAMQAGAAGHHDGTELWGSNFAHICDRTPESQCVADGSVVNYSISTALDTWATATRRGYNLWGNNTGISAIEGTATDVYVTAANRPDVNAFAWGQCAPSPTTLVWGGNETLHTRWCRPQWVYWNSWSASVNKITNTAKRNYIGCHESGHTIGLRHRATSTTSCMAPALSGPANPSSVVPEKQNPQQSDYDRVDDHY